MSSAANCSACVDRASPPPPVLPRSAQHGEARERAEQHRAVAVVLNPDQRPQQRRLRRRVLSREALDLAGRQSGDLRDAFRRVVAHARHERVESDRVPRHVFAIDEIVADHHVHHREGEGGVARGFDRQVPVRRFGGSRPDRIDDDDLCSASLRFADERPEVQVRDDRVRAPQHDEAAVYDLLGIDAGPGADGRGESRRGDGTADVPLEFRAAHRSKEPPVERFHLNEPLRASGAVGQDRFGSRFRGNRLEPRADVGERLVPGDTNEIPLTLPADALQRVQHAIGVVHALEVVIHLRAERAAGERVRLIARQLYGRPVPHFDDPRAGVRTVVPARAAHHRQRRGNRGHGFLAIVARISVSAKDQVPTGTRIRRRVQCRIQVQYSAMNQVRKSSPTTSQSLSLRSVLAARPRFRHITNPCCSSARIRPSPHSGRRH